MIGKTIKIKKEHKTAVKEISDYLNSLQSTIICLSRKHREAERALFNLIYQNYPNLKEYHLSINHEKFEISILSDKKNS